MDAASLCGNCHCGMEALFCLGSDILDFIEREGGRIAQRERRDVPNCRETDDNIGEVHVTVASAVW